MFRGSSITDVPFGIIGLGRFGLALAETLARMGKEIVVLDSHEDKIKMVQDKVSYGFVAKRLDKATLSEAGIQNCQTVIICIGEEVEASILATLNVIELGVPQVIAKAISYDHGKVLSKIGAKVVYPERDMAVRLANMLTCSAAMDYIELSNEISIEEIKINDKFVGKNILELNFRKKYNLNVIAIVKEHKTLVEINPDIILEANDYIVVIGKNENINRLEDDMALRR